MDNNKKEKIGELAQTLSKASESKQEKDKAKVSDTKANGVKDINEKKIVKEGNIPDYDSILKNKSGNKPSVVENKKEKEQPSSVEVKNQTSSVAPVAEKTVEYKDPAVLSLEEQNVYFGKRVKEGIDGSIIQYSRFNYKTHHTCKVKDCFMLLDKVHASNIGVVPRILLKSVWKIADAHSKFGAEAEFHISKDEWEKVIVPNFKKQLEKYDFYAKRDNASKVPLVQDVFRIPELDYQEMFLKKSADIIRIIDRAVRDDIKESLELKSKWKKIKRYKHKVRLDTRFGGIFSAHDVSILQKHGIYYVNDLRKHDVYELKNMLLEHTFAKIIEEIHLAYKEDIQRRHDRKLRRAPLFWGFVVLIASTVYSYQFKYTLLKNADASLRVAFLMVFWVMVVLTIICAAIRAKHRHKKGKCARYFTGGVRFFSIIFSLFSIFTIGSVATFYQRYDGYNDYVYYRDIDENTIAVAGIFTREYSNIEIPREIDGKTVVRIDGGTFYNNEDVYSVTIPDTVTEIRDRAFYKGKILGEVTLPDGIEYIGKKAFDGCVALSSVNVPESVASIGEKAFRNCSNLDYIELHDGIEKISDKAFLGCKELLSIGDISGVTELGDSVFSGCKSLKEIVIPEAITVISKGMFEDSGFESIKFEGDLESIGKGAFKGCDNLRSIDLSDADFADLDKDIFRDCEMLETITLPSMLTEIPEGMARGCKNLQRIVSSGKIKKIGKNAFRDCAVLFEINTDVSELESIGKNAFRNCDSITDVMLPDTVSYIGRKAFFDCENLTAMSVPFLGKTQDSTFYGFRHIFGKNNNIVRLAVTNATEIKRNQLRGADKLEGIAFGEGLTKIPNRLFKGMWNLTEVYLPSTLTHVGDGAFRGCNRLYQINLEDTSLQSIGKNAFRACNDLISITLPESVETIGKNAFRECNHIEELYLSDNLTSVAKGLARDCSALQRVTLGSSVTEIASNAFENCASLTSIVIPDSVETIGYKAFANTYNLESVEFGVGLKYIKNKAFEYSNIRILTLNEGVEEIGYKAFSYCRELISAYVPDSVVKMRSGAFDYCDNLIEIALPFIGRTRDIVRRLTWTADSKNLETVVISSAKKVKGGTFRGFNNIIEVVIFGEDCDINTDAFEECGSLETVYLQGATYEKFKNRQISNGPRLIGFINIDDEIW